VFYRLVRSIIRFALSLFYRLEIVRQVEDYSGPVLFVGNHPNSLIDPGIVFAVIPRQLTFLAKEPLFRTPIFGQLLKGLGALPVYRKVDHPGQMEKNEGTLETAAQALIDHKAITIFPEGKSHSAPQISDIKTGCARIALRAARGGSALRIVPVGLTYQQKTRFRSRVHVEVGHAILVDGANAVTPENEQEWVKNLTEKIDDSLRNVTLNLETWEDIALIETADKLLSLKNGFKEKDPERMRLLAKGATHLRNADAEAFSDLKDDILSYRARLDLLRADPQDLHFEPRGVVPFVVRNLVALILGLPLFLLGLALFCIPFLLLKISAELLPLAKDRIATFKLMAALVVAPLWWVLLASVGAVYWGIPGFLLGLLGSLPLALFTRYFLEHRNAAIADANTFLRIGSRQKLRQHLLFEGERLQEVLSSIVQTVLPKL
jgi:glycerol-3-phosphate O-acyltransferase / dihydroxyacetone phosphate acyltransferase